MKRRLKMRKYRYFAIEFALQFKLPWSYPFHELNLIIKKINKFSSGTITTSKRKAWKLIAPDETSKGVNPLLEAS